MKMVLSLILMLAATQASAQDAGDPFLNCRLNVSGLSGRNLATSVPFKLTASHDGEFTYAADAGLLVVRFMFSLGHEMKFKYFAGDESEERDESLGKGYFALRALSTPYRGGALTIINSRYPEDYNPTQIKTKQDVFRWAVDEAGRLRGSSNYLGEDVEHEQPGFDLHIFKLENFTDRWIATIGCGSLE